MANINVRKRIEKVSNDLEVVLKHVVQHSGISQKDAQFIDNVCAGIVEMSARIAAEARTTAGDRSGEKLVKGVRRAMGYTIP